MKYFVIFLVLIGLAGTVFGQYLGDKLPPETMIIDETGEYVFPPSYGDFYYSNPKFEKYSVIDEQYKYVVPYTISNGSISEMSINCNYVELILDIKPVAKQGWLTLALPRQLVDSQTGSNEDDVFIVLSDSKEIPHSDTASEKLRILLIPFSNDTSQVNIIGVNYPEQMGENACNGKHDPPFSFLLAPLKQFKSGISPNNIICKEGLQLVLNWKGNWVCVKNTSVEKLAIRNYIYHSFGSSGEEIPSAKTSNHIDSIPLTLFPITPQNVTLPNTKTLTDTTMISINKINQITITNSDPNGQKTHLAQITIKSATLHPKGIESLPAQSGFDTLVFDYSIQSKDKDAFYASLDFAMQFGAQTYLTSLNGDEFSTPLLPDQKRDSSFAIQVGESVNQITITVKDSVTQKTLWIIPLDLTPYKIKYHTNSGILIQENEN